MEKKEAEKIEGFIFDSDAFAAELDAAESDGGGDGGPVPQLGGRTGPVWIVPRAARSGSGRRGLVRGAAVRPAGALQAIRADVHAAGRGRPGTRERAGGVRRVRSAGGEEHGAARRARRRPPHYTVQHRGRGPPAQELQVHHDGPRRRVGRAGGGGGVVCSGRAGGEHGGGDAPLRGHHHSV